MIDLATTLYGLLATGAGLAASAGAGEFGKKAVGAAFDAIKARLTSVHNVGALDRLDKPAFAEGIKSELAAPEVAADAELPALIEALRAAIAAVPQQAAARYAVNVRDGIESARNMTLEDIEGLQAASLKSGGDLTLKGIKAPPGKP